MELSFLSDTDVQKCASFSVNERFDLHDERFGSIKSTSKCTTCGRTETTGCYGHYGSLYLGVELFHPMYYREITTTINTMCHHCGTRHDNTGSVKGGIRCKTCNKITYTDYTIPVTQSYAMKRKHGVQTLSPSKCKGILRDHPNHVYIISHIIVPPTGIRPPEDVEWPSDISRIYARLVETVKNPSNNTNRFRRINQLYNSIVGYTRKDGVIKALSGKRGIFRTLMLGKRLNRSARLVITGDPLLDVDQLLVPYVVAAGVRISERVWHGNVDRMKQHAASGELWWESEEEPALPDHVIIGKVYDRALRDDDLVMLNRQPSLTKHSLLALRVKTGRHVTDNVFAINPSVTPSFNADFDGDEMNIYAGYGPEARAELCGFCSVSDNIYDPLTDRVYIHPIQDVVSAVYMMTQHPRDVSMEMYHACCMLVDRYGILPGSPTTVDLVSLSLPPGIPDYDHNGVTIRDGKVQIGSIVDKSCLCRDLILHIGKTIGHKPLTTFIGDIQKIAIHWLDSRGMTLKISDCTWDKHDVDAYRNNQSMEWALERTINKYHTPTSTNPLSIMLRSGAKGKDIGATQMAICIGEQHIGQGTKIGFIGSSYIRGMNPKEYFYQASAAISGVVDIGTSVSAIGYANRRVSKLTADVTLGYNGVIGTKTQIVQLCAGNTPDIPSGEK